MKWQGANYSPKGILWTDCPLPGGGEEEEEKNLSLSLWGEKLTLSTDAPVSGDANPLTDPIFNLHERSAVPNAPIVLLLRFVREVVALRQNHRCHQNPFGDRWAVNAADRGDGNV